MTQKILEEERIEATDVAREPSPTQDYGALDAARKAAIQVRGDAESSSSHASVLDAIERTVSMYSNYPDQQENENEG